jgi:hypothetical protein
MVSRRALSVAGVAVIIVSGLVFGSRLADIGLWEGVVCRRLRHVMWGGETTYRGRKASIVLGGIVGVIGVGLAATSGMILVWLIGQLRKG